MWSLINTAFPGSRTFRSYFFLMALALCLTEASSAQMEAPHPPATVVAGTDFSISTAGSGKAIFYFVGPSFSKQQHIDLGREIYIKGDEVSSAGRYLAVLCSETCAGKSFYVTPAKPASLAFL